MRVIYTRQNIPIDAVSGSTKSIFLAGPTPRSPDVVSWRPSAIELLKYYEFDGIVFYPEWEKWDNTRMEYINTIDWEHHG